MRTVKLNNLLAQRVGAILICLGFLGVSVKAQSSTEVEQLKTDVARQEQQILELRKALDAQQKLLEQLLSRSAPAGPIAESATPARDASVGVSIQPIKVSGELAPSPETTRAEPIRKGEPIKKTDDVAQEKPPLSLRIGDVYLTPAGFLDFTAFVRDRNVASGLGTNFGSIPLSNTPAGQLSENRLSAQNSRLGLRLDARFRGNELLGYLETDFLGVTPTNVAVTTNSNGLRMRLFWLDLKHGKWEFLGGQSWSLLTPNRKGLSPLPADIFSTYNFDPNLQVGMVWSRDPQFRVVYHANRTVTLGLALEASEQYGGGSAGAGRITLPAALVSSYGPQLDTGDTTFAAPNLHPEIIGKIAFDPKVGDRQLHFELAGVVSSFEFFNPRDQRTHSATGGGVNAALNVELFKNFRFIGTGFYSDGGGRWIFGLGPDLIIKADGEPSLVHSASTVSGFEYQPNAKNIIDVYYGGAYVQKNTAIDLNGQFVGYGYPGSPSNHNRSIQEITAGHTYTFWRDPNYGALQFITQYSYLVRHQWSVAPADPNGAHVNMLFLDLRYLFPGAAPTLK